MEKENKMTALAVLFYLIYLFLCTWGCVYMFCWSFGFSYEFRYVIGVLAVWALKQIMSGRRSND